MQSSKLGGVCRRTLYLELYRIVRELKVRFRDSFYVGLGLAIVLGVYLIWLWQPERQVARHTATLLHEIEARDWSGVATLLASDYSDQWGEDNALVLSRLREVFRYVGDGRIVAVDPIITTQPRAGTWRATILIEGEGEVLELIKQRVNSLHSPFQLEWRQRTAKPWDWQLVRVTNPDFEIPGGLD
jgi:hypothetical protein